MQTLALLTMGLPYPVASKANAAEATEWFEANGELNDLIAGKNKPKTYKVRRKEKR